MLDDCVSYLDGTIFNIQSKITDFDDATNDFDSLESKEDISHKLTISSKFQKLRYLSRLHLQLGAVLSQINKHEEALQHGKTAALYCQDLIKNTELLCKDYLKTLNMKRAANKSKLKYINSPPARRNSAKR
jgi:hypothetical protein